MAQKKEENLSKEKLLAEIERLKKELKKRKKYGLVWEERPEEVVEMCKNKFTYHSKRFSLSLQGGD